MNVSQAKTAKDALCITIADLLRKFTDETGLSIEMIHVSARVRDASDMITHYAVEIEARL